MTVKISVSLPDDVGEYLAQQGNASAAVTDAVRFKMAADQVERAARRHDAQVYVQWARENGFDRLDEIDRHSADLSMGAA